MANHTAHYELSHSLLARSDVIDVDPSLAPLFFSENVVSTYFGVAFLTVILYNASKMTIWANALCSEWLNVVQHNSWFILSSDFMIVVLIDYILLLRVLPLYDQSKRLSICLKLLLTAEVCTGLSILIYGTSKLGIVVGRLAPGVQFCAFDNDPVQILGIISW
ncbi:uncharacterized protein FOMMEDRAFT_150784 [Fomitiporia mediterranea MF3/22]|uniref:uncharacterized protein n=1 Tax=Fomitiporia mediterranea (strain MF3/22) TaxID=694068 RepID=UPI00044095FB|nr:uncharacterized protein FOMMEDRAFT_150784 [Fomitiporia mediterranea MF3/22]EJD08104.1 hypothetical protein FOMMEDRAFT_150784 [Fomitiporia mediterranea MF3/22]